MTDGKYDEIVIDQLRNRILSLSKLINNTVEHERDFVSISGGCTRSITRFVPKGTIEQYLADDRALMDAYERALLKLCGMAE